MEPPFTFESQLEEAAPGYVNAFAVPEEVSEAIKAAGMDRLVCTVNQEVRFHCSLQSKGNGRRYYLMFSRQLQRRADVDIHDTLQVSIEADTSKYGLPVPEEWAELLAIDEEVSHLFAELTPGRQRSILHLVATPKREETRIQRALRIADNLKLGYRNPKDFLKN